MKLCTECTLPNWDSIGKIKRNNEVMGLKGGATDEGTEVVWEAPKSQSESNTQLWVRSLHDQDGMFTLKNPESGLYLLSKEDNKFTIEKKDGTGPDPTNPPPTENTTPHSNIRIKLFFFLNFEKMYKEILF